MPQVAQALGDSMDLEVGRHPLESMFIMFCYQMLSRVVHLGSQNLSYQLLSSMNPSASPGHNPLQVMSLTLDPHLF